MAKEKKYIISPATLYDEDEMLWYTKVGVEGGHIPLHYTVWGKTEAESRSRSEWLVSLLAKEKFGRNLPVS